MKKTLKQISKHSSFTSEAPFTLIYTSLDYPAIPDNTSNFIEDYEASLSYDNYAVYKRGSQVIDLDLEDESDLASEWYDIIEAITNIHLDSWARLYYALNLSYNPIWNVDGSTVTVKDAVENTIEYGEQEITAGTRSDSTTYHTMATDSSAEKETGKDEREIGQQINTAGEHTDTHNLGEQTETVTRTGNQGVTMTQQMLESEWNFRRKAFFESVLNTMLDEIGFYYDGGVKCR